MAIDSLLQNLRYTLRTLRRDAGMTMFIILIAGFGIGASSTVFSVVNTLLLRPLPFADAEQLVWIANRDVSGLSGQTTQVGHMVDLRERTQSLSALAGFFAFYGVGDNVLSGRGEPERLNGVPVSDNFFQVLGVQPLLGRLFTAEECQWNGPKAVLLSHGLWQRRFASDPAIVGTALTINDELRTVVGVLPESFDFGSVFAPGSRFDLYFPFPLSQETNRWGNTMAMIGRLEPGWSAPRAQAELRTLGGQISKEHPERNSFEGNVKPLAEQVSGRMRLALWVLAGAVGVVMLIVCANLSNLLLARTASRHKEMAIRSALGAGRQRLMVQMLTEGVVLSSSGAALGFVLAMAGTRLLAQSEAVSIPLLSEVQTDRSVLLFTLAMAGLTGILFGLAPALQARSATLHDALKDAAKGSTENRSRRWVREQPGRLGDRVCVRAVGGGRTSDSKPDPRARRRHGFRLDPCGNDPRRSGPRPGHARKTERVCRRSAAPCQVDPRRRCRRHHRRPSAWEQSHLGRTSKGRHLRARPRATCIRTGDQ